MVLKGDGKGNFTSLSILQSGIYIPGNGKALVKLRGKNGKYLIAAGQNRGPLKVFELKRNTQCIALQPNEVSGEITFENGKTQRMEFYYGASFLSQSARFLSIDDNVKSIVITDSKNGKRKMEFTH